MTSINNVSFKIHKELDNIRLCDINTTHGIIKTPAFLFCATKGTLKSLSIKQIKDSNTKSLLCNTYHLMIRPGSQFIKDRGGLHKFMAWDSPIFMDSGGYQIFGLGYGSVSEEIKGIRNNRKSLLKITEDGATFVSYLDGSKILLTPEKSIQVQRDLKTDIAFVLDECTPFNISKEYTENSMHMSHRWEKRSYEEFMKHDDGTQGLYGIMQGGVYEDLREVSANFINNTNFFGRAIGGSLGSTKTEMYNIIAMSMSKINRSGPIHLLGIGCIKDIFVGVKLGIDTFDCVHPTRIARHGAALIDSFYWIDSNEKLHNREHIDLSKSCFANDDRPISSNCLCDTCKTYSRAYLHYLIKAKEILYIPALTTHNVFFMNELMQNIRNCIAKEDFISQDLDALQKRYILC